MTQAERPSRPEILRRARGWIQDNFLYTRSNPDLGKDEPLLGRVVDSVGVVELVEFLQDAFGVTIADEDMTAEHFNTLTSIADLIEQRLARADGEDLRSQQVA